MNSLVFQKIREFERTSNPSERIFKVHKALEFIVCYYSAAFYYQTKAQNIVSEQVIKTIQMYFHKRNTYVSSWIKLLRYSLELLGYDNILFDQQLGLEIQKAAMNFLPENTSRVIKKHPNLRVILDSILIIRNKVFGHANDISPKNIDILNKYNYSLLPQQLSDFLEELDISRLYLLRSAKSMDTEPSYKTEFLDLGDQMERSVSLCSAEDFENQDILSSSLYFYFAKFKRLFPTAPFLLNKDDKFYLYNGVDESKPIYGEIFDAKYIPVKKYENAFLDLIAEDIDLLNSKPIKVRLAEENDIFHNVPTPLYRRFIGRKERIRLIKRALDNRRIFLVSISGVGGVGKSAVAIKTARDFIENGEGSYRYIVWVSAKRTFLTPQGVKQETQVFNTLTQLFDVILVITGFDDVKNYSFQAKKDAILDILSSDSFLLIIDNFETIDNPQQFLAFFEEIGDRCVDTKILVTTRHQLGSTDKIIDLREFSYNEYVSFIKYLMEEKFQSVETITKTDIKLLYSFTGGLALATEFILGQISNDKPFKKIIGRIKRRDASKEDILEFSYTESFSSLNDAEQRVLFSISLLDIPNKDNILFVSSFDEFDLDDALERLKKLSFVNENTETNQIIYSILPLTKIFVNRELEKREALKAELELKVEEFRRITEVSGRLTQEEFDGEIISSNNSLPVRMAKAAYLLAGEGEFSKSEKYFKEAIELDEAEPMIWFYRAKAEKEFSNILVDDYYDRAIQLSKNPVEQGKIQLEWGKGLADFNRHLDAVAIFANIVKKNQKNKNAWHLLGKSYYQIGRNLWLKKKWFQMKENYQLSSKAFIESLYAHPSNEFEKNTNTIGFYFLSKISFFLHDIEKALHYVRQGLSLQPNNYKLQEFEEHLESRYNKYNTMDQSS